MEVVYAGANNDEVVTGSAEPLRHTTLLRTFASIFTRGSAEDHRDSCTFNSS